MESLAGSPRTVSQQLLVHGFPVLFESPVSEHHERLREDYGLFFVDAEEAGFGAEPDCSFVVEDASDPPAADMGSALVFDGALGDTIWIGPTGVRVRGPRVADPKAYETEVRAYFTALVLRELTRRRTANLVHSSAVIGGRGGVLFAGAKKMGKSSLAMLCALDGAQYVSNDMTLLALPPGAARGPVTLLGLPQPITLNPGATHWFGRRALAGRIAMSEIDVSLDAESLYTLESGAKARVDRAMLGDYTVVAQEGVPLGSVVFPEPNLDLAAPRARLLDRDEAVARLVMLVETFLKWRSPAPLAAEELLDRIRTIVLATVDSVPCWHLQWCADHDRNLALLQETVL